MLQNQEVGKGARVNGALRSEELCRLVGLVGALAGEVAGLAAGEAAATAAAAATATTASVAATATATAVATATVAAAAPTVTTAIARAGAAGERSSSWCGDVGGLGATVVAGDDLDLDGVVLVDAAVAVGLDGGLVEEEKPFLSWQVCFLKPLLSLLNLQLLLTSVSTIRALSFLFL